jgi:hypothetical protein
MSLILSPQMSLPVPVVGEENGPQFAIDINNCMSIIDGHNHTLGSGALVPTAGLDINTSLSFQGNSATSVGSIVFTPQASPLTGVATLYVAPNGGTGVDDLWYDDGAGNQIALTLSGAVNATIANLPGESYSGGTFTWAQGPGSTTPAFFDIASVTIRPATAGTTNGVTVNPPSAISSAYSIYLPPLPGATSFLTIDTGGNITGNIATSGGIAGSNIASGTVTGTNIAAATVTGANIASSTVTGSNIATATIGIANMGVANFTSASFSNVTIGTSYTSTGATASITTHGRPVIVLVQDVFETLPGPTSAEPNQTLFVRVTRDSGGAVQSQNGGFVFIDTPTAGAHTYTLYMAIGSIPVALTGSIVVWEL